MIVFQLIKAAYHFFNETHKYINENSSYIQGYPMYPMCFLMPKPVPPSYLLPLPAGTEE